MSSSQELFISEQHPVSRRWAIIEDDGRVAWLYLTEPDMPKPMADCWLYNRVTAPVKFDSTRGGPPVVPESHAHSSAVLQLPPEAAVHLRWSQDGESVAVLFDIELIGFIAQGHERGFSRHIRISGPFGNVLDTDLFKRVFEGT